MFILSKPILEAIFEPFTVKHITDVIDKYEVFKDDYDEESLHFIGFRTHELLVDSKEF